MNTFKCPICGQEFLGNSEDRSRMLKEHLRESPKCKQELDNRVRENLGKKLSLQSEK